MSIRRAVLAAASLLIVVAGLLAGATGGARVASADSGPTYVYCVLGAAQSGGVERYTTAPPGLACYRTLDEALAAIGQPPSEFWSTLPKTANTNVPAGGSFDPKTCTIILSHDVSVAMAPGEVYWGRCDNGGLVAMTKAPNPGGVWFAPAPQTSSVHHTLLRRLNLVHGLVVFMCRSTHHRGHRGVHAHLHGLVGIC